MDDGAPVGLEVVEHALGVDRLLLAVGVRLPTAIHAVAPCSGEDVGKSDRWTDDWLAAPRQRVDAVLRRLLVVAGHRLDLLDDGVEHPWVLVRRCDGLVDLGACEVDGERSLGERPPRVEDLVAFLVDHFALVIHESSFHCFDDALRV